MAEIQQDAMAAEAALANFLSKWNQKLWPEERQMLQEARHFMSDYADS